LVEQQEKEEKVKEEVHSLLKEICVATLYTDKKVSFVGVVDSNGNYLLENLGKVQAGKKELPLLFISNLLYFFLVF
jgi:hypothetical protein